MQPRRDPVSFFTIITGGKPVLHLVSVAPCPARIRKIDDLTQGEVSFPQDSEGFEIIFAPQVPVVPTCQRVPMHTDRLNLNEFSERADFAFKDFHGMLVVSFCLINYLIVIPNFLSHTGNFPSHVGLEGPASESEVVCRADSQFALSL